MALNTQSALDLGHALRPRVGETVSGDTATCIPTKHGVLLMIADSLGHGPDANVVALQIDAFFANTTSPDVGDPDVSDLFQGLNRALAGSRGAAVGLAYLDESLGRLDYVGVGNTVLRIFGESEQRLVSQDGIVGQTRRQPRLQGAALQPGDLVVLYTDGISDRFGPTDYPGMAWFDAQRIAETILQRFGKSHDDACCLVARYPS